MDPNIGSEENFFSEKGYALLQRILRLPTLYLPCTRSSLRFLLKYQLGQDWRWHDRIIFQRSSWREGDGTFLVVFEQCRAPLPPWRARGHCFREIGMQGKLVVHGCTGGGRSKQPRGTPDFLLDVKN